MLEALTYFRSTLLLWQPTCRTLTDNSVEKFQSSARGANLGELAAARTAGYGVFLKTIDDFPIFALAYTTIEHLRDLPRRTSRTNYSLSVTAIPSPARPHAHFIFKLLERG